MVNILYYARLSLTVNEIATITDHIVGMLQDREGATITILGKKIEENDSKNTM